MLNSRRIRWLCWCIIGAALLLRLAAAAVIDRHVTNANRQFLIEGDANGYWELGKQLAAGKDYTIYTPPRRVLRMPGFPLLMAACIRIFGDSIFAASLVLACVGTACCWLTNVLGRRVTDRETAALALLLTAVSPMQTGSSVLILSETWFTFWMLLCLITLSSIVAPQAAPVALQRSLVSGLLTGLAVLVRPGWILWTGFSGLIVLTTQKLPLPRRVTSATLILTGCFLVLLPWAWRNQSVTGHWVFTSLWSGPSLYDGLHPGATGASDMSFVDQENIFATLSEFDANAHYKRKAIEFAWANPGRTIELAFLKAGRFLSPVLNAAEFSGGAFSLICLSWYTAFWGFMIAGIANLRKKPEVIFLLAGPFLQFLLVHMVFVGSIRYRLPVEFPLSILAARGIRACWQRWQRDQPE